MSDSSKIWLQSVLKRNISLGDVFHKLHTIINQLNFASLRFWNTKMFYQLSTIETINVFNILLTSRDMSQSNEATAFCRLMMFLGKIVGLNIWILMVYTLTNRPWSFLGINRCLSLLISLPEHLYFELSIEATNWCHYSNFNRKWVQIIFSRRPSYRID